MDGPAGLIPAANTGRMALARRTDTHPPRLPACPRPLTKEGMRSGRGCLLRGSGGGSLRGMLRPLLCTLRLCSATGLCLLPAPGRARAQSAERRRC